MKYFKPLHQMVKVPLQAYLFLPYRVYDAITTYAYQHNKSTCSAVAHFVELGLYEYFKYDADLKHRFDSHPDPVLPSAPPCECDHSHIGG